MGDVELVAGGGSWITRALAASGAARVLLVEADEVAEATRLAHGLDPAAAHVAAEAVLATLLLSAYAKGDEKLTLQLAFDRPSARYLGEMDPERRFRARFSPSVAPPDLDARALSGLLFAAKHDGVREVYRGVTAVSGSITDALRAHLQDSSQIHGILSTAIVIDEGKVRSAVGVLVERLPMAKDQPSLSVPEFVRRFAPVEHAPVSEMAAGILRGHLLGEPVELLDQRPVFWGCTCSMERVVDALRGLSPGELRAMAREDGGAVVDCHFCNSRYQLSADRLLDLADRADRAE